MIIDSHVHTFTRNSSPRGCPGGEIVERALAAGIDKIALSSLGRKSYIPFPTEDEIRESNRDVLTIMKDYPGRVYGFCYINPLNPGWEEELERCSSNGFTGIKLWVAVKCREEAVFPVIEKAIDKKMTVLLHSLLKANGNPGGESNPYDVAFLAGRYPEAGIIMAHAGGNRKEGLESLRLSPNVSVDTSGTHAEIGTVETAVSLLGAERVLFGSDAPGRSFAVQLQKVRSAVIESACKELVLHKNFMRIIGP